MQEVQVLKFLHASDVILVSVVRRRLPVPRLCEPAVLTASHSYTWECFGLRLRLETLTLLSC